MPTPITRLAMVSAMTAIAALSAHAHPGSGIVVGDDGRVYFVHGQVGVWAADPDGELELLKGPAWHFLIADPSAKFAEQRWPRFPDGELRATGPEPALLRGSSFPIAIGPDGALYYPQPNDDGRVHMMRTLPGNEPEDFLTLPPIIETSYEGEQIEAKWLHGLAAGRDGSLYYTEQSTIRRVSPGGEVSVVAENIKIPDCTRPPAFDDGRNLAFLRGIDVAKDGTVYAAASGCSAVIKVTPDGTLSAVLRAEQPWSPTGVAVKGGDLYVLEFQYIDVQEAAEWLPRVRKRAADGTVTTIATIEAVLEQ